MKKFTILFLVMISCCLSSFGTDYTFCYGSIAVTLNEGGRAKQVRYGTNGAILKTVTGEWTAYGYPTDMPGQTIKIKYSESSEEFSYVLVRDGARNPSVLIDGQGRRYTLCKKSVSKNQTSKSSGFLDNISNDDIKAINKLADSRTVSSLNIFVGSWQSTDCNMQFDITEIPYTFTEDEVMQYSSKEKKISLRLIVYKDNVEIFNGTSNRRGTSTLSGQNYVEFINKDWNYKIGLNGSYSGGEKYQPNVRRYKKDFRNDGSFYWNSETGFDCSIEKSKTIQKKPEQKEKINSYGGIVFYFLKVGDPGFDPDIKHGLVVSVSDLDGVNEWGVNWLNQGAQEDFTDDQNPVKTGATGIIIGTGSSNTKAIIASQGTGNYAAKLCHDYRGGGFDDWYLPSKAELNLLFINRQKVGQFTKTIPTSNEYWSSSEYDGMMSWVQSFKNGKQTYTVKHNNKKYVRAIRFF